MTNTTASRVAAAAGFLAVALGAHGLRNILAQKGTAAIWETAVFYHFIHAVMLFVLAGRKPLDTGPWWCFLAGIQCQDCICISRVADYPVQAHYPTLISVNDR